MPDEPNLNPTQSANVPDPAAPTMTDPQKLVDEALAAPAPLPTAAPTLPTEAKTEPTPEVPETEEATVPAELITPPATPSVESLPPSPEPAGAPDTSTSTPPVTEPTPPSTPPSTPAETPMTDEMPLAFAGSIPTETPKVEEPVTPTTTITTTIENTVPGEGAAPPVFVPPAPSMTPPVPEKKKRKGGKVLAAVLGFFLLAGGIVGGYYYYLNNFGEKAQIAAITDKAKCSGCSKPKDGGWLTWKNGKCTVTGICNSSKENKPDSQNPEAPADEKAAASACKQAGANGNTCCGTGYTYCGGGIDKCVSHAAIAAHGGGCNSYGEQVYNIPTVYGANYKLPVNGACPTGFSKSCQCGGTQVCFDKTGFCDQKDAASQGAAGTDYNTNGLCAVAGSYSADGNFFQLKGATWDGIQCNDKGCSSTNAECTTVRYTCSGTQGGTSCLDNQETGKGSFAGKCGTVEQVDVMCNGQYVMSRTQKNPPCDETTTTTTTPTLACSGISKDKAAPKIGDQVQFTCAGTVTPAGATNLTYQFQIMKDAGEWTALTATGNKATYTIASAGNYQARCKACGTINNASVCDPSWTGVTP